MTEFFMDDGQVLHPHSPPGWTWNPSGWKHRLSIAAAAAVGFCIAMYLALYQWHGFAHVWEPFFSDPSGHYPSGSERVLHSWLSQMLPVPDAFLGACGYAAEIAADLIGGRERWHSVPAAVLAFGLIATLMAAFSLVLILIQAFSIGAFCTLCLASAAISLGIVGPAWAEVLATLQYLRRQRRAGRSLKVALIGTSRRLDLMAARTTRIPKRLSTAPSLSTHQRGTT